MFDLSKKNIIITGSSGLMGYQFTDAIIIHNGNPILIDINSKNLKKQMKYFNHKYNINLDGYCLDITKENLIKKNHFIIKKKYKKIDALINNAAINPKVENKKNLNDNTLENFSLKKWKDELDVSLTGSFLCSKYYGKIISENQMGGVIINISSDLGLIGPNQSLYKSNKKNFSDKLKPISYSVSKSGLLGMTKYIATYWSKYNVRCNALCPGGIENNQSKEFIKKIKKLIPLNRMAKKNEYQSTIIWMLSDETSYLNGSIISVDGGRTAW